MLLEKEKDGTGSKRMARAVAFLEAAGVVEQHATRSTSGQAQAAFRRAADELRDMAVRERNAHDAPNKQ